MRYAKGFTVWELLAVVIIFVVLAAILFPVFVGSRQGSPYRSCESNLKLLELGMIQYEQDYDQRLPLRQMNAPHLVSWRALIYPYLKSKTIYVCPSDPAAKWPDVEQDGFMRSYAVNSSTGGNSGGPFSDNHPRLALVYASTPASTIALVESTAAFNDFNPLFPAAFAQPTRQGYRTGHLFAGHQGMTNMMFLDGHCKSIKPDQLFPGNSLYGRRNPWTIDGSAFSPADQATAKSTLEYAGTQDQNLSR